MICSRGMGEYLKAVALTGHESFVSLPSRTWHLLIDKNIPLRPIISSYGEI